MSRKMTEGIDYTCRDYEAFKDLLITKLREKIPEYTDTSETDAGIVILEALANGLDILSFYLDVIANDVILPTTQDRKIAVMLANLLGYIPYNQTASELIQVFVLEGVLDVDTTIPKGTVLKTPEMTDIESIYFETEEDLIIPAGCMGNEKDSEGNYLYTVTAIQGQTVEEDILGTSSGAPLQTFELNYTETIIDSILLYVDEGLGAKLWTRVESFMDCTPDSTVYKATLDEFNVCTIEFGDGLKGKIPSSYVNGISASYRIGGGSIGNVGLHTVTELETFITGVYETYNVGLSVRGHDKEDISSIKEKAPANFRSRDRLVTLQDYKDVILANFYEFYDIVALCNETDKKMVDIYYIMRKDYYFDTELLNKVSDFINDRRMIGTSFRIIQCGYQEINITSKLYVDSDYNKEDVAKEVKDYLSEVIFSSDSAKLDSVLIKSQIENEIKESIDGVIAYRIEEPTSSVITSSKPYYVFRLKDVVIDSYYL